MHIPQQSEGGTALSLLRDAHGERSGSGRAPTPLPLTGGTKPSAPVRDPKKNIPGIDKNKNNVLVRLKKEDGILNVFRPSDMGSL